MTRIFIVAVLVLFLGFLMTQIYVFWGKKNSAEEEYMTAKEKLDGALVENEKLERNLQYFANPLNFEKELRARFNYKEWGEKTIIFVPSNASSAGNPGE